MCSKWFSGPYIRQYAVVIVVNLSVLNFGLNQSWLSPVMVKLGDPTLTILPEPITEEQGSWLACIPCITTAFCIIIVPCLADRIGRKKLFLVASIPKILCTLCLTFATQFWVILLGKALDGFASSMIIPVVPIYASEIASKEIRGNLGAIMSVFMSLGTFIMLCVGPFVDYFTLNAMMLGVAIVTTIPLVFLPESPMFLHNMGKTSKALKIQAYLRGLKTIDRKEVSDCNSVNSGEQISLRRVFGSPSVLKSLTIVIVMAAGTQLTGASIIASYLQTILQSTETNMPSEFASVMIGVTQMFAAFFTSLCTDRLGRKPIIVTSLLGMFLGLVVLGAYFKILELKYPILGFMNLLPMLSLSTITFCYSAGMGALLWPLTTELFEIRARAIGMSFAQAANVICTAVTSKYFCSFSRNVGPAATYWTFAFNSMLLCMFIVYCVPETKGKSFKDIQKKLGAVYNDKRQSIIDAEGV